MSRSLQELEAAVSELKLVSILDRDMREPCTGTSADVDAGVSALGEFTVPRDEIGVHVCLDDVLDLPPVASGRLQVNLHIPLRIENGGDTLRSNHVGRVGQATQIESFHSYQFHAFPSRTILPFTVAARRPANRAGPISSPSDTSSLPLRRTLRARLSRRSPASSSPASPPGVSRSAAWNRAPAALRRSCGPWSLDKSTSV